MRFFKGKNLQFAFLGMISALLYSFVLRICSPIQHNPQNAVVIFYSCVLIAIYIKGLHLIRHVPEIPVLSILFFPLLFIIPLMGFEAFGGDINDYINQGWLQSFYHLNPYIHIVTDVSNWNADGMFWQTSYLTHPAIYGFLFLNLMSGLTTLGHGDFLLALTIYKSVVVLCYLAIAWMLWLFYKNKSKHEAKLALFSFLWNPLILLFCIGYGHNDIFMALFLTLGFLLLQRGQLLWVLPLVVAAILVKYAPIVVIPPLVIFLWRKCQPKVVLASCLLSTLLAGLCALPFLHDGELLKTNLIVNDILDTRSSLIMLLSDTLSYWSEQWQLLPTQKDFLFLVMHFGIWAGFIGIVFWQCWGLIRKRQSITAADVLEKSALFYYLLICVVINGFWSWYLGPIFVMALLMSQTHWLRVLVIIMSCVQVFAVSGIGDHYFTELNVPMRLLPFLLVWYGYREMASRPETAEVSLVETIQQQ